MKNIIIFRHVALVLVILTFVILLSGAVAAANKDLTVTSLSASGHTSPGQTVSVSYTIKNKGTSNVNNGFYTYFYLTPTKSLSGPKTYLGSQHTSSLSANSYITNKKAFKVPKVSYGTYYVAAKVDAKNSVPEKVESNNILYSGQTKIYKLIDSGVTNTKGYIVKKDAHGHYSTGISDQAYDGMLYPTKFYWKTYQYPNGVIRIYTNFYHTTLKRTIYQTITIGYFKPYNGVSIDIIPKCWGGSGVSEVSGVCSKPSTYYWKYFRSAMIEYAPSAQ